MMNVVLWMEYDEWEIYWFDSEDVVSIIDRDGQYRLQGYHSGTPGYLFLHLGVGKTAMLTKYIKG